MAARMASASASSARREMPDGGAWGPLSQPCGFASAGRAHEAAARNVRREMVTMWDEAKASQPRAPGLRQHWTI